MSKSAADRAVVITGASTGIGAACALHLARRGMLVFPGVRRQQDGEALKSESPELIHPILLDVTDEASIARAASSVADRVGRDGIWGVINNAGVTGPGPIELLPLAEVRRQINVNLLGAVATTQAFLPLVRRQRGRIVNMGSASGCFATPFFGVYSATKAALERMTDSFRLELAAWGIHVSVIVAGRVLTPIHDKALAGVDEIWKRLPAEGRQLYEMHYRAFCRRARQSRTRGIHVHQVVTAVEHALVARRPKSRYLLGRDARRNALASIFLPSRARDWLLSRRYRLPKRL